VGCPGTLTLVKKWMAQFDLLFVFEIWAVILQEGHRLRVFNNSLMRKLGPDRDEGKVDKIT
jgi:hypothetical protein